jgi:S-adenosylmethionine/arginine decarboxylase-like enzyme
MVMKHAHSPLWRIGFYHCEHFIRLRVGKKDTFARRIDELDDLLSFAGLKIVGRGVIRYSRHGAHGYTYFAGLVQSGIVLHTYPERNTRSATINIETCEPRSTMQPIIDRVEESLRAYFGAKKVLNRYVGRDLPLRSKSVRLKPRRKKRKRKKGRDT